MACPIRKTSRPRWPAERDARENGAEPATIAVLGGKLCAGLTAAQIDALGRSGASVAKASRRDLPVLCARGQDGATTVAGHDDYRRHGRHPRVCHGGIGGVHRGAETTMDISADLEELARTPVAVVCAGAKSILDLGLTLEYLETHGVPVIGYGTDELPAFYTRTSGFGVDVRLDTPADIAQALSCQRALGYPGGALVVNPIPEAYSMDKADIDRAIAQALEEAGRRASTARRSLRSCWRAFRP